MSLCALSDERNSLGEKLKSNVAVVLPLIKDKVKEAGRVDGYTATEAETCR
jgi:hypothetical protein